MIQPVSAMQSNSPPLAENRTIHIMIFPFNFA